MSTYYTAKVKVFEFTNSDADNNFLQDEDGKVYKVISATIDGEDIICKVRRVREISGNESFPILSSIFANKRKPKA